MSNVIAQQVCERTTQMEIKLYIHTYNRHTPFSHKIITVNSLFKIT